MYQITHYGMCNKPNKQTQILELVLLLPFHTPRLSKNKKIPLLLGIIFEVCAKTFKTVDFTPFSQCIHKSADVSKITWLLLA